MTTIAARHTNTTLSQSLYQQLNKYLTHAPETGTENLYQKTGTIFRTEFFSVPDETGSKISGLFFLYYFPSNSF